MSFSKPKSVAPPPPPPPPKDPPRRIDASVQQARTDERKQARAKSGRGGTLLTNTSLSEANTAGKTLLGQ